MTDAKPAVTKSSMMFVVGMAIGLVVGGLAGVYIGAYTDSGSVPKIKAPAARPPAPGANRDDIPAPTGSTETLAPPAPPADPKPEAPK